MANDPIVYTDKIVRSSRADYEAVLRTYRDASRPEASIRSRRFAPGAGKRAGKGHSSFFEDDRGAEARTPGPTRRR
jgi:hypothetical protein